MRVINLSSGSEGNLTYVESENSRILVDDGLSCKETENRLSLLGVKGGDIDAIVVTHEHVDHIKGVDVFSKKYDIPVFAHNDVWVGLNDKFERVAEKNRKVFAGTFEIGDFVINPVEIPHDVKCFGFSITQNGKKVCILTDLGHTNDKIFETMKGANLAYIEANHDLKMLQNTSKYPLSLKMRIAGKNGHLSNDASADFIAKMINSGTKQIVLSHLSKETNSPEIAFNSVCEKLSKQGLIEGETFRIDVALTRPTTIFKLK